jgi:NAD(P)-dependent dehydrogenase (short-subunit alcohol dehydrogenase family)
MLLKADLTDPQDIKQMFDKIIRQKGKIDILVNNAGIYEEANWLEMEYEEWQQHWHKTIDTNLTGMANLSFLVARQMAARGGGKIINVSSRGAFRGEPNALPYGAGKAAMNSFGQSMAWALADKNVQIFTLAPGWVDTDMTHEILLSERGKAVAAQSPMNRVATPAEIAYAVLLLAAPGNEYMTGCILDMNGASYLRT